MPIAAMLALWKWVQLALFLYREFETLKSMTAKHKATQPPTMQPQTVTVVPGLMPVLHNGPTPTPVTPGLIGGPVRIPVPSSSSAATLVDRGHDRA